MFMFASSRPVRSHGSYSRHCFRNISLETKSQGVVVAIHFALEDLAVNMVVGLILPALDATSVYMRSQGEELVSGWPDLNAVAVRQRGREINWVAQTVRSCSGPT
jgi:hypothetical protein